MLAMYTLAIISSAAVAPVIGQNHFHHQQHQEPALQSYHRSLPAFQDPVFHGPAFRDHHNHALHHEAPAFQAPLFHDQLNIDPLKTVSVFHDSPSLSPHHDRHHPEFNAAYPPITIVQRQYQADDHGQFISSHTDSAGTTFQESGKLVPTNDGLHQVLVKTGYYSYISPDGTPVQVSYTADATGFHPSGNAIPVVPQPLKPTF